MQGFLRTSAGLRPVLLEGIEEGRSKVMETNHTLILGWNEGTIRVIIQIAFLRALW